MQGRSCVLVTTLQQPIRYWYSNSVERKIPVLLLIFFKIIKKVVAKTGKLTQSQLIYC